ncbi:MAG: Threonylcarbamoyl-AMP synthase [Pseudomonadota bacterium]|jgi:L-threonylcarbamoyladenylate synthase
MNAGVVREADPAAIAEAARRLIAGEVVALPTETVYGLGADAASAAGVASIYRIKGRPAGHPLIVHVLGADQAEWWGELGPLGHRLAAAFWPGPLTLIVRRRAGVPAHACGEEPTIGLRSPAHPVARALLAEFTRLGGHGIAAPSANRFGRVSPTRAEHVWQDLGDAAGLILDGGPCEVGVESTIIDLSRGRPVLLRPGGIPLARLIEVLGAAPDRPDARAPKASGTLAAHYAPRTPVELVDPGQVAARAAELAAVGRIAVWSRTRPASGVPVSGPTEPDDRSSASQAAAAVANGASDGAVLWEPAPGSPERYAQALYETLRRLDEWSVARILVERVPPDPAWDAVRDRLARAAATFAGR